MLEVRLSQVCTQARTVLQKLLLPVRYQDTKMTIVEHVLTVVPGEELRSGVFISTVAATWHMLA